VYKGLQEATSRPVAIKVLSAGEGATGTQRLRAQREAEIAASLSHPNIVAVYESRALHDGRIAIVMEFVDGVPLDQWIVPGETPQTRQRAVLTAFVAIAQAVHHSHLNGVIHRDLKPDNILITSAGRPVVLDFGIARLREQRTTSTGEFAGTPAYASPEQVSGQPDRVDALTDIYSLGVLLYKLLCGVLPYELSGSIFDLARTIQETAPIPPRVRDATLSADLDAIICKAIEKDKQLRYQSAASFSRDLQRYLSGEPVDARSGSGWYLMRKAYTANRGLFLQVSAALLLLVGAGVVIGWSQVSKARTEALAALRQREAESERVRAQAVFELMQEMMPSTDTSGPEIQSGLSEGLNRLYYRLETGEFAAEPELDLSIRRLWSGVYTGLGPQTNSNNVAFAEVSLRNGLVRLRQVHGREHPEVAAGLHELGQLLIVRDRLPEALLAAEEALAIRIRLLGPMSLASAETQALLAHIHHAMGHFKQARHHADQAVDAYQTHPEPSTTLLLADIYMLRAQLLHEQAAHADPLLEHDLREALVRYLSRLTAHSTDLNHALSLLASVADKAPQSSLVLQISESLNQPPDALGEILRADLPVLSSFSTGPQDTGGLQSAAMDRLVKIQSYLLGESHPALIRMLLASMRAAQLDSRPERHLASALRAADILAHQPEHGEAAALVCLEEAAVIQATVAGNAALAVELSQRAQAVRQRVPLEARDRLIEANSLRNYAWFLTLDGKYLEAIPIWRNVSQELKSQLGDDHHVAAIADSGLAFCLAELGELEEADRLSEIAERTVYALAVSAPDQRANASFVRGHVLFKSGQFEQALVSFSNAWSSLYATASPTYAWRKILLEEAAQSCNTPELASLRADWLARDNSPRSTDASATNQPE
jgi:tetratricopeptide (TPR) repeat protein